MDQATTLTKLPTSTLVYMITLRVCLMLIVLIASFFVQPEMDGVAISRAMLVSLIVGAGLISCIHAFLYYTFFSYSVGTTGVIVNSGIVIRESKTIDFSKIQNINIVQGPILMMFGLASTQIWTASPSQVSYTMVTTGPNGQRGALPKPTPEAVLIITKTEAESLRLAASNKNTPATV